MRHLGVILLALSLAGCGNSLPSQDKYFSCSGRVGMTGTFETSDTATVYLHGKEVSIDVTESPLLGGDFYICDENGPIVSFSERQNATPDQCHNPKGTHIGTLNKVSGQIIINIGDSHASGSTYAKLACKEGKK